MADRRLDDVEHGDTRSRIEAVTFFDNRFVKMDLRLFDPDR
jgi:hypothetical protein